MLIKRYFLLVRTQCEAKVDPLFWIFIIGQFTNNNWLLLFLIDISHCVPIGFRWLNFSYVDQTLFSPGTNSEWRKSRSVLNNWPVNACFINWLGPSVRPLVRNCREIILLPTFDSFGVIPPCFKPNLKPVDFYLKLLLPSITELINWCSLNMF